MNDYSGDTAAMEREVHHTEAKCPKCGQLGTLYGVDPQDFITEGPWAMSNGPTVRRICSNCVRG